MTDKEIEQLRVRALASLRIKKPFQYYGPQDIFQEMQNIKQNEKTLRALELFDNILGGVK